VTQTGTTHYAATLRYEDTVTALRPPYTLSWPAGRRNGGGLQSASIAHTLFGSARRPLSVLMRHRGVRLCLLPWEEVNCHGFSFKISIKSISIRRSSSEVMLEMCASDILTLCWLEHGGDMRPGSPSLQDKHSWQLLSMYGLVYTPISVVKCRNIIIEKKTF